MAGIQNVIRFKNLFLNDVSYQTLVLVAKTFISWKPEWPGVIAVRCDCCEMWLLWDRYERWLLWDRILLIKGSTAFDLTAIFFNFAQQTNQTHISILLKLLIKSILCYVIFKCTYGNKTVIPHHTILTAFSAWLEVTTFLSEMATCELPLPDIGILLTSSLKFIFQSMSWARQK